MSHFEFDMGHMEEQHEAASQILLFTITAVTDPTDILNGDDVFDLRFWMFRCPDRRDHDGADAAPPQLQAGAVLQS